MKCRQARTELALWAGGDLSDSEARLLERHCAVCPDCRALREGLRNGQAALQAVAIASVTVAPAVETGARPISARVGEGESLWPALAPRLAQSDASRARRFNGWIPALAVTAACVAVIFVAGQNAARYAGTATAPQPLLFQPMPASAPASEGFGQPLDGFGGALEDLGGFDASRRDVLPPWWNAPRDAAPRSLRRR